MKFTIRLFVTLWVISFIGLVLSAFQLDDNTNHLKVFISFYIMFICLGVICTYLFLYGIRMQNEAFKQSLLEHKNKLRDQNIRSFLDELYEEEMKKQ